VKYEANRRKAKMTEIRLELTLLQS
jgi:hypothetical protein